MVQGVCVPNFEKAVAAGRDEAAVLGRRRGYPRCARGRHDRPCWANRRERSHGASVLLQHRVADSPDLLPHANRVVTCMAAECQLFSWALLHDSDGRLRCSQHGPLRQRFAPEPDASLPSGSSMTEFTSPVCPASTPTHVRLWLSQSRILKAGILIRILS